MHECIRAREQAGEIYRILLVGQQGRVFGQTLLFLATDQDQVVRRP